MERGICTESWIFTDIPEELHKLIQNSSVHLIEVRKFSDTNVFRTDVRQVFDFIRCSENREALKQLTKQDPAFQSMEEDAYHMLALYAKAENLIGKVTEYRQGGKINMCKALEDMVEEGRQEGRQEGIRVLIETLQGLSYSGADVAKTVKERFALSDEDTEKYLKLYWVSEK